MTTALFTDFAFATADAGTIGHERTLPERLTEIHNVMDFGALGDGSGAMLNTRYASLAAAQAVYPFVTNITTQTIDWAAITAAYNYGQVILTATGASSVDTIPFASVPASVKAQMLAVNTTNNATFPLGTPVEDTTGTTVRVHHIATPVQSGDVITFNISSKGVVYFPAGTYAVSEPINLITVTDDVNTFALLGELGASTITGNFADYVISRGGGGAGGAHLNTIENLTIVNTHAAGGGIRLALTTGGTIRNCSVTANRGINTEGIDNKVAAGGAYYGSFEFGIENCRLSPGSNVSGSTGILMFSNGHILNCQFIGCETGLQTFGGQGATVIMGCYFEQCSTGYLPSVGPDGDSFGGGQNVVSGCWFKNNSIAIDFTVSLVCSLFNGLRIEGTNGQAPGAGNPQYGMRFGNPGSGMQAGSCTFFGITITGNYDHAGVSFQGVDSNNKQVSFKGVQSASWDGPTYADTARFFACNLPPVYTFAHINSAPGEGASFNISDANSSTWGATPGGSGSTHAKVRYNGSAWTVAGI